MKSIIYSHKKKKINRNKDEDFVNMYGKVNKEEFEILFFTSFLPVIFIHVIFFVPTLKNGFLENI